MPDEYTLGVQVERELAQAVIGNLYCFLQSPASFLVAAEKILAIHPNLLLPASLEEIKNIAHEKGLL